jgi:hypothetical protein
VYIQRVGEIYSDSFVDVVVLIILLKMLLQYFFRPRLFSILIDVAVADKHKEGGCDIMTRSIHNSRAKCPVSEKLDYSKLYIQWQSLLVKFTRQTGRSEA